MRVTLIAAAWFVTMSIVNIFTQQKRDILELGAPHDFRWVTAMELGTAVVELAAYAVQLIAVNEVAAAAATYTTQVISRMPIENISQSNIGRLINSADSAAEHIANLIFVAAPLPFSVWRRLDIAHYIVAGLIVTWPFTRWAVLRSVEVQRAAAQELAPLRQRIRGITARWPMTAAHNSPDVIRAEYTEVTQLIRTAATHRSIMVDGMRRSVALFRIIVTFGSPTFAVMADATSIYLGVYALARIWYCSGVFAELWLCVDELMTPAPVLPQNVTLPRRGIVLVAGRNGAGKSTLLRNSVTRNDTIYLPQSSDDMRDQTWVDAVGCLSADMPQSVIRRAICDCGLMPPDDLTAPIGELSGGQVRRLMLARVIATVRHRAAVRRVILDEPDQGISADDGSVAAIIAELGRANARLVLVAMHNAALIDQVQWTARVELVFCGVDIARVIARNRYSTVISRSRYSKSDCAK